MESQLADLIVFNAKELLTLFEGATPEGTEKEKKLGLIHDGAVAVKDGRIIAVGKSDEVIKSVRIGKHTYQIDASNKVVMPGFVDPHTHLIFAGTREKEFILRHQGVPEAKILKEENTGIISTVRHTRKATFEELLEETKKHLSYFVDWGTTTIEVKSGYGLNLEEEIKMLKIAKYLKDHTPINIKSTLLAAHIIPPEYHMRDEKYVELVIEDIIPIIAKNGLADFNDVWCEKGQFTREQAKKILTQGKKMGLKPKIHADEYSDSGGAEVAAAVQAISADHLVHSNEEALKKMKDAGVTAVLLPCTMFFLGKDTYPNYEFMKDIGITVALGTDFNPGTSFCPSMPFIISLAIMKLKMTVEDAIIATTKNAAKAIDMEKEVGTLEVGKRGNINILDIAHYEEIPYRIAQNYVETVISNGEILKGG
ncbi:imidazolonepropionase [Caldisericum exile]|uniref:Imidazolonepropionase n=1 Tax=Caldisericum exile (strain DSM 21853 / NBRC 104410 / AZM16c01) TaxID=511051 RepID=A0A7U6GFK8_CALEA|nr:imidazolonepropionase [Caldisericum exile]BAL81464.1 imidazolonepropionase [Caldisericum exile AZM16c01]